MAEQVVSWDFESYSKDVLVYGHENTIIQYHATDDMVSPNIKLQPGLWSLSFGIERYLSFSGTGIEMHVRYDLDNWGKLWLPAGNTGSTHGTSMTLGDGGSTWGSPLFGSAYGNEFKIPAGPNSLFRWVIPGGGTQGGFRDMILVFQRVGFRA